MNRSVVISVTILALMIIFGLITPHFLSDVSLRTSLRLIAYPGIVAIGVGMGLIGGTIDLSVGATAGLTAVVAAKLMASGYSVIPSLAAGLAMGALVGIINAALIIKLGLSTFIATLGTTFAIRGVAYWLSRGYYIYPLPDIISTIGEARPLGLSWAFIVFVALLAVFQWLLSGTVWGLTVRATGSDREVASCTEVNVDRVQAQLHVIVSTLAAITGLLVMSRMGGALPTIGTGMELTAIAGCVIGGLSLFGYEGSMFAVFLGLVFLQVVLTGVITAGVNVLLQPTMKGAIMLAAMLLDVKQSNTKTFFRRVV